jgi:VIT1/CCC1 family predicted Fe2+/Mn2+ transporter
MRHRERHLSQRAGWLRAAVLGANDGIVSTAALVLGVAAAETARSTVLTAGMAGLVAGSLSMAVGEYVSVSAQRDSEQADIAKEREELAATPERELDELTGIYRHKGLSPELARQVAVELSKGDVLAVHLREELGITEDELARPIQASVVSAASFALGAALPLAAIAAASAGTRSWVTFAVALIALAVLGAVGARLGGAAVLRPTVRLVLLGAGAMGLTVVVGSLFGAAVG